MYEILSGSSPTTCKKTVAKMVVYVLMQVTALACLSGHSSFVRFPVRKTLPAENRTVKLEI